MYQLGSPFAVDPNTSKVSLKPRPHVLFVEPAMTSKLAAVRLEPKRPLRNANCLP